MPLESGIVFLSLEPRIEFGGHPEGEHDCRANPERPVAVEETLTSQVAVGRSR